MIVDVNTYLGHWPFRKLSDNTAEKLDMLGRKNGITHMMVSSLNAVFYKDAMQGNQELYDELKEYKGQTEFIPLAIINPTYPAWEKDLLKAVNEFGFKGVELCPIYHGYSLLPSYEGYMTVNPAADVFKLAGELGLIVRINACFENLRQRHRLDMEKSPSSEELVSLLSSSDKTVTLLNGFVPFAMGEEVCKLIKTRRNVFFDTTGLEILVNNKMERTLSCIGDEHLCFGSLAPFNYPQANLIKILFTENINSDKILYENLKDFI